MGVLFLILCFLSRLSKSVIVVYCLSWPSQLVCSQGMPAGIGSWDTVVGWEVRRGWSVGSTGDVGREGWEALVGDLLQPWGQDRGTGFRGTEKKEDNVCG